MSTPHPAKLAAARMAVDMIKDGMRIGIGTGSTAALAIEQLGEKIRTESISVVGAPTSFASERLAQIHGVPTAPLAVLRELDLAFDGADEVSPQLDLIKGRGAAHTREKVVATSAESFVVLVDDSKLVTKLGEKAPVPVEILPMSVELVTGRLERMGAEVAIRMGTSKDGPVVSDQGFWILDARFSEIADPAQLDVAIKSIPGVLDHGLFIGMATTVLVGSPDGSVDRLGK